MKNILKVILCILLVSWMTITFMFSGQEGIKSTATSQGVIRTIVDTIPHTKYLSENDKKDLIEKWKKPVRKIAHYSIYLLGGALIYMIVNIFSLKTGLKILISQIFGILFAIFDELHQLFVPGRSGEVIDVCIDSLGIFTGIIIMVLIIQMYNSINQKVKV